MTGTWYHVLVQVKNPKISVLSQKGKIFLSKMREGRRYKRYLAMGNEQRATTTTPFGIRDACTQKSMNIHITYIYISILIDENDDEDFTSNILSSVLSSRIVDYLQQLSSPSTTSDCVGAVAATIFCNEVPAGGRNIIR